MSTIKVSPAAPTIAAGPPLKPFDDIFTNHFNAVFNAFKSNPNAGPITAKEHKAFIEAAFNAAEAVHFPPGRQLSEGEKKQRALTKVMCKIMADEPWSENWIRPHDVERKLSRFELHPDSLQLAIKHGYRTPKEAIMAAREALIEYRTKGVRGEDNHFQDIEVIYIPGTVSSTATNAIDRSTIYPISVESVASTLQDHMLRGMTRPYEKAQMFIHTTDPGHLKDLKEFACNICDYAPHLLDNDNVSLLIVLLILTRSEICKRFENNGIRIEGSTISHRRSECLKNKLGWKTAEDRKPFDLVATDLQTRIKNILNPHPNPKAARPKTQRRSHPIQPVPTLAGMGVTIPHPSPSGINHLNVHHPPPHALHPPTYASSSRPIATSGFQPINAPRPVPLPAPPPVRGTGTSPGDAMEID
jgi:hypothetical protein